MSKKIKILNMVEFSKHYADMFEDYDVPLTEGIFKGKLVIAHWVTHRYIYSFWLLENGTKLDCILFPEQNWLNITNFEIGQNVTLTFVKSSANSAYLRNIENGCDYIG